MIEERFVASTPTEAYALAMQKYGKEQLKIIAAKQLRYDDGKVRAEVVVEVPEELFHQANSPEESQASDDEVAALHAQIETMKALLEEMKAKLAESSLEHGVVADVKARFMAKGIASSWLDEVLKALVGTPIIEDASLLVSYLLEEIDETLKVKEESLDEPLLMMLVGPTGVGKTTTIAKLAARYAYLLEKPLKVALINLDSYKVGASEQLANYADIMQIEHFRVETPEAFASRLDTLTSYDVVLVDTAGMSPYDTQKFVKTVSFLKTEVARKLEVHLVLPATVKYEDMDDIYQNFSFLNPDAVILSKFDETKHLGTLLNFMLCYKMPMSYFSIGQEVPDDLLVASKEYLLERFIGDVQDASES